MSTKNKRLLLSVSTIVLVGFFTFFGVINTDSNQVEAESNDQLFVGALVDSTKLNVETIKRNIVIQDVSAAEIEEIDAQLEDNIEEETLIVAEETITETIEEEVVVEEEYITEEYNDSFMILCSVVEAETHGASQDAKIRIVHVIRNRINDSRFPNDYYSVCTAANQFASRWDIEQSTIDAVNMALNMEDTTQGALFFCTCSSGCYASSACEYLFTDNVGHHFWK